MITAADRLALVNEYYFSQKMRELDTMRQNGANIINLGIGSPDMPPHPNVITALQDTAGANNTHAYQSYKGIPELRIAFQQWYKREYNVTLDANNEILPLIGSKEGIMHICMAFLNPGDIALIPNPGYPTYAAAAQLAGAQVQYYHLDANHDWQPDFDTLSQILQNQKVKILFLNYPNMPTGATAKRNTFERLIALAHKHSVLLVHDNPYSFVLNEDPQSILSIPNAKEVAIELNSLSKSHNMAGWRIGMLGGSSSFINAVLKFKSNMDSGMFLPIQKAAIAALNLDTQWYQQLNSEYAQRRMLAFKILTRLGCIFNQNQKGMFVWASIPSEYKSGFEMSDFVLNNHHVFITPGGIFGSKGNNYIRVSLCASQNTFEQVIERLN